MVTATVVTTATARTAVHGVTTTTAQVTHLLSVVRVATVEWSLLLLLVVLRLLLLVLVWIVVPLVMLLLLLLQVLVMWWVIAITTAVEIRLARTGRGR